MGSYKKVGNCIEIHYVKAVPTVAMGSEVSKRSFLAGDARLWAQGVLIIIALYSLPRRSGMAPLSEV